MKPIKIHHVAIAVQDIDAALKFWEQTFGLELTHVEEVPSQKSKVAFLPLGESEIELVQPTTSDSGLANFLEKRGEGMHHICIEVEDIDATLAELKSKGVRLINDVPEELPGRKMAFVHPRAANGVLVELYQLTENN